MAGTLGRPPSMMDVVSHAGVSHQTVSRVLNGTGKVAPATRERILEVIEELGYRRNSMARALVTRRSGIVGIVTTTSVYYGPSSLLLAIELAARQAGYFTGVAPLEDFSRDSLKQAMDHFLGLGAEGVIVLSPVEGASAELASVVTEIPLVAVTSQENARAAGVVGVSVDQRGAARQAVEHLLALGHREIVHVMGSQDWYEARGREQGWREALEEAGLPARSYEANSWESEAGYACGQRMVAEGLPTAVFTANDGLALGVVSAFAEAGVAVPEDVSVVGFDDEPFSAFSRPPLTTIRQDFDELGRSVVEALADKIRGEDLGDSRILQAKLVVRRSTAAPRKK